MQNVRKLVLYIEVYISISIYLSLSLYIYINVYIYIYIYIYTYIDKKKKLLEVKSQDEVLAFGAYVFES